EPPPAAPPRRSPSGASPSSRTTAYPPFGRRPRAKGFTGGRFSQKNSRGIQEGPRVRLTGGGAVRQAAGFLDPSRVFAEAQGPGQKAQRPKAPLDALPHDLRLALDQKVRRGHPLALLSSACVHPPETVRSLPTAEAALGTVDTTARLSYIIL